MRFLLLLAVSLTAQPIELKVAAVQFRSSFDIADNTARIIAHLDKLAGGGVQVAAFPECAVTGYHTGDAIDATAGQLESAAARIGEACARNRIAAVVGSVYKVNGRAYNVALVYNEKGERVERYGKLQLAGEKWATPGNHMALFDLRGVPSTVIICHDERYPEFVRLPALAGARIVYYISHESGMKNEEKLPGYRAQMMARAVENQMFAVAANAPGNIADNSGSHGHSRIIKDDGNILEEASIYGEDVIVSNLRIKAGKLTRPLKGVTAEWWKQGLGQLLRDRTKQLD
ncbi:MAG: carbon-nitrogen hydrolase family protein [Bryobacterales bacterium]|nr:carbon-nitrogen hydrolase family protein [Bryobacterales bacterium]